MTLPGTQEQNRRPMGIPTGALLTGAAWLVTRVIVGAASMIARNPFTFDPQTWAHHDSYNYVIIAEHGISFARCPTNSPLSYFFHNTWCGNVQWLPGYPWLVRIAHAILPLTDGALLISWLALAVALFLVWWGWGRDLPIYQAFLLLVLFGVFPGAVYNFAIFPMAVTLALLVGALLAAKSERFWVMATLMIAAGLCYPDSWAADLGLTIALVVVAMPHGRLQVIRRGLWGIAGLTSILILGIVYQAEFGHFDAYFLTVRQVDTGLAGGLKKYFNIVFRERGVEPRRLKPTGRLALSVQALSSMLLAASTFVVGAFRRQPALIYPAFAGAGVIASILASGNDAGWTRSVVLAAPCVLCLRRVPWPLLLLLAAFLGLITALIARPFFTGALI